MPKIANNFFSLSIIEIEGIAHLYGYHVLIYLTHDDCNKEVFSKNQDENIQLIKNLLDSANSPTGIFASVEKLALTTYNVCNKMSLKIPGDVKVVGFSNLESANLLNPPRQKSGGMLSILEKWFL